MCDPEWKIKTGVEIFCLHSSSPRRLFGLLGRWHKPSFARQRLRVANAPRYKHILSEGLTPSILCSLSLKRPEQIKQGLHGAYLPFVTQILNLEVEETTQTLSLKRGQGGVLRGPRGMRARGPLGDEGGVRVREE